MARFLRKEATVQKHSAPVREAIAAMEAGDTARALSAGRLLATEGRDRKASSALPRALGEAFRLLLKRRGYYVSTPDDLTQSLEEIHSIGEGFDLYDLASTLARLEGPTGAGPAPLFPELIRFLSTRPSERRSSHRA